MERIRSIVIIAIFAALGGGIGNLIMHANTAQADPIGGSIITRVSSGSVGTSQLRDLSVTTAKLAAAAVTTAKITDANITTAKIADNAVTTAKVGNDQITSSKMAAGSVTSTTIASPGVATANITDLAVTTAKIANQAVTWSEIAIFSSTQQTGTGAAQNIAHGLGVTPQTCLYFPEDTTAAGIVAGGYAIAPGTNTSTNCVVTATANLKFRAVAVAP